MIKTYDRTPNIYSKESRSFQLLGHLFDAVFNTSKLSLDNILSQGTSSTDPKIAKLLCNTLGFISKDNYTVGEYIGIIKSFKLIINKKGTQESIEECIKLLLNSQHIKNNYYITGWDSSNTYSSNIDYFNLLIYLPEQTKDINLLDELFNYVLPAGWNYSIVLKSFNISDTSNALDLISRDSQRRRENIDETSLGELNYVNYNENDEIQINSLDNIGEVPYDNNEIIVGPAVNIGTVFTDENQMNKYIDDDGDLD